MDTLRPEAAAHANVPAGDPRSRLRQRPLPRRQLVGMLAVALTTGLLGIGTQATETEAKGTKGKTRRRRKRSTTQPALVMEPSRVVNNNADANDTALSLH